MHLTGDYKFLLLIKMNVYPCLILLFFPIYFTKSVTHANQPMHAQPSQKGALIKKRRRPQLSSGHKTFFLLNSTVHEIYHAHKR